MAVKVEFLQEYSAKTAAGEIRTVAAGAVLNLSPEKAERLITAGIVLEIESEAAIWKWFFREADKQFQPDSLTPGAWNQQKKHRHAAQAFFADGRIPEAREELAKALTALRGVP
jgi:hypothetical protein